MAPEDAEAFETRGCVVAFPSPFGKKRAGADVERINPFKFFELAQKLHALDGLNSGTTMSEAFWAVFSLRGTIEQLIAGEPIALRVSRPAAVALHDAVNGIVSRHFTKISESGTPEWKYPDDGAPPIAEWEWNFAKQALATLQTVFAEEMREAAIYRVPDRGIFDTAKLIDAADATFPAELMYVIPKKTRDDWCAAGRCLAFNLLSASGFHVARAVEAMLEVYYQAATGKAKSLHGWQDYIAALTKAAAAPTQKLIPSDKVIAGLTQMKGDYRNPIMHPRVVLTEADARMLFANGEAVITAMAQEVKAVAPPLSLAALIGPALDVAERDAVAS